MTIKAEAIDRLKSQLLTSGLQQKNNSLFQIINQLIEAVRQGLSEVQSITSGGGGGGGILSQSYVTYQDDQATLPNSRQVIAGIGISFNLTSDKLIISAAIPIPRDGEDGQDGTQGPIGLTGAVGPIGPMGPPGFDSISGDENEYLPFVGNSILTGTAGNFTQVI